MTLVIPDIICIGADLGTRKVTLAVWYNDKLLATGTMSFTHEAAKDFHLNSMVFDILNRYSMVAMGFLTPFDYKDKLKEAAHIFIEETYCGKNKRDFKALSQVLTRLSGIAADIGYTVHTITNNDWTGAIGCTPRTKAPERKAWTMRFVNNLPEINFEVDDQDHADAIAIGYVGKNRVQADLRKRTVND